MIMILHETPSVDVDESFSNVGVYETPYFAGGAHMGSKLPIIELEEVVHKSDTILVIFKNIPSIHTPIECMINFH